MEKRLKLKGIDAYRMIPKAIREKDFKNYLNESVHFEKSVSDCKKYLKYELKTYKWLIERKAGKK